MGNHWDQGSNLFCHYEVAIFPNYLNENFQTDQERSEYILNNLTYKGE